MRRLSMLFLMILFLFSACQEKEAQVPLPTEAKPEEVQTAIIKTQNAPPPGFDSIAFNPIDYNREKLPGWAFEVTVTFTGQYTATGEEATGYMLMRVWENSVLRQRRVLLQFDGEALSGSVTRIEAVRVENDFYLVDSNRICTINNEAAQDIATLSAGRIVGGFTLAIPTGRVDQILGFPAYQYGFDKNNLQISIFQEQPSTVDILGGEAWLIPELNVVGRFGVGMNVHNAKILFGENAVTGELNYQYNLVDVNETQDIAIPNGC